MSANEPAEPNESMSSPYSDGGIIEPGTRQIRISASDSILTGTAIRKLVEAQRRRIGIDIQPEDSAPPDEPPTEEPS